MSGCVSPKTTCRPLPFMSSRSSFKEKSQWLAPRSHPSFCSGLCSGPGLEGIPLTQPSTSLPGFCFQGGHKNPPNRSGSVSLQRQLNCVEHNLAVSVSKPAAAPESCKFKWVQRYDVWTSFLMVPSRSPLLQIPAGAMTLLYNGVKLAVGISGQKSKNSDSGKSVQTEHLHWKPPERILVWTI